MRDLVDIGGCESDCGDSKQKAEVVYERGDFKVMVGNNLLKRFDGHADDYACTRAEEYAARWNAGA